MPDAYLGDTVALVAQKLLDELYGLSGGEHNDYALSPDLDAARAVLNALAERGLLLPEGAEQRTEHGVRWSEDRIESWPEVSTYSSREQAEIYATAYPDLPGEVIQRDVITTLWSAIPPEPKKGE
jgi:hypothetical protein